MPQTWEFANVGQDCTPEIVLKATNPITAGEKVLLFQVLNGCYGRPMIITGTSVNGQASEMVIGFGDATGNQLLEIDKNYDNLEIKPFWHVQEYIKNHVLSYYKNDEPEMQILPFVRIDSYRKPLYFEVNHFDLIKDYSPQFIVEKYTHAQGYGNRNKSSSGFKPSRLVNTIDITEKITEIDFRQEEFFRINENGSIKAKSYRNKRNENATHCYLQFRIRLSINGVNYTTIPLLKLKMIARALIADGDFRHNHPDKISQGNGIPSDPFPGQINDLIDGCITINYRRI